MSLHPDKKPFKVIRNWLSEGVQNVEYEADFWEGPDGSGNETGYRTLRCVVSSDDCRNKVNASVSFWPELAKALGLK